MKQYASARELTQLFPEKWEGKTVSDVHSSLRHAVETGKIERTLSKRNITWGPGNSFRGSIRLYVYRTVDVKRWLKSSNQLRHAHWKAFDASRTARSTT